MHIFSSVDITVPINVLLDLSNLITYILSKYRNRFGQLLEHSPFCERDIKTPTLQKAVKSEGDYLIKVKTFQGVQNYKYVNHPFDVVGWDGYYFPWIISINNFEPIVGSLHQPPPVHQTFQGSGFVLCSFVPRLFDFHKDSIPAPYPHSNIDSDEIVKEQFERIGFKRG